MNVRAFVIAAFVVFAAAPVVAEDLRDDPNAVTSTTLLVGDGEYVSPVPTNGNSASAEKCPVLNGEPTCEVEMPSPQGEGVVCNVDKTDVLTQFDCVAAIAARLDLAQIFLKANHGVAGGEKNFFYVQAEMLRIKRAVKSLLILGDALDEDVAKDLGYQVATLKNLDITMEAWYTMYVNPAITNTEKDCENSKPQTCG